MATLVERTRRPSFTEVPAKVEPAYPSPWPALIVKRAEIEQEIERLLELSRQPGERRASEIIHPESVGTGAAVTPGLSISINVLRPQETLKLFRDNATRVEFILGGEGTLTVGGRDLPLRKWSVTSMPSMMQRTYRNDGHEPLVWLSYSNKALLRRLGNYFSDNKESVARPPRSERTDAEQRYVANNAPDYAIGADGARLRGYEFVTDIEVVQNKPLVWPWNETSPHLASEHGDGKRNLLLLVNPATGRRQGSTQSFFAALTRMPRGSNRPAPPRGHKHSSFAVNYHFEGSGESIVDGNHFEWEAGDLMLSAPAWGEHAHGIKSTGASILTVQDHPFHMAIGSLIWQEEMDGPILTLGSEEGQTGYVGPRLRGD